jgi:hypothetical protein
VLALISALIDKTKMLEFGTNFIVHMKWYEIPTLIDKTKMLEFGANFIVHMKWYEIPISFI